MENQLSAKSAKNGCFFFLSLRVETANGEFLGVIAALLNVDRCARVFENSRFNADMSIALVHAGGKIIARVANFEQAFGRDLGTTVLFNNVRQANAGTYKTVSVIDNLNRVFSSHVIDSLPLIIGGQ